MSCMNEFDCVMMTTRRRHLWREHHNYNMGTTVNTSSLFYGMGTICIVILLCIVGSYFRARRRAREIAEVQQRRTLRDNESASIIKQRKIQLERKVITMVSIIILFSFEFYCRKMMLMFSRFLTRLQSNQILCIETDSYFYYCYCY